MISKSNYKPRFVGYNFISGIIKTIDGIISIIVSPFGYVCTIYPNFCVWNLGQDTKKYKNKKKLLILKEQHLKGVNISIIK